MLKKPDFIYIGLKRSASTYLRGYFDGHPGIVWQRESGYLMDDCFCESDKFETERDVPDGAIFIEVNELLATGLIAGPDNVWETNRFRPGSSFAESGCRADPAEIAVRVKRTFPQARIILTLRNQIDWLRTHYRVFMGDLPPGQHRFRDFLTTLEGQLVHNGGFFHRTVEAYFDLFGRDNVHVALFEDIRDDEPAMLRALCGFLGVRQMPYDPRYRRYNRGPSNTAVRVKAWFASAGIGSRHLGALRPLARALRPLLPAQLLGADPLSEHDRRDIAAAYADSNRHTAKLIGRDLGTVRYPW